MESAANGPHGLRATVSAELLPVDFDNRTLMAPVVDGMRLHWSVPGVRPKHWSPSESLRCSVLKDGLVQYWDKTEARDIWVWLEGDSCRRTRALRLVIQPVTKDDAQYIRAEYDKLRGDCRRSYFTHSVLDGPFAKPPEAVRQVVQEIADHLADARSEQRYRLLFGLILCDLPNQFAHMDGKIVQLGTLLGSCERDLKPDDAQLLKQVWLRLPLMYQSSRQPSLPLKSPSDSCPACGRTSTKRESYKQRAKLRKALRDFNKEYPQNVFNDWIEQRLRSRPGDFTYTSVLYSDYVEWTKQGGNSHPERAVIRHTVLSRDLWGRLMGARYDRVKRNGRMGYRSVALKGTRSPRANRP